MKKVIFTLAVIAAIGLTSCNGQQKEKSEIITETTEKIALNDVSFGVRGNCGMCKKTIEKAANSVEGVAKSTWDKDKKMIQVLFDGDKTNEMAVQNAIAASGYDTEKVPGNEKAYENLPGCCKYDNSMEMNQSGEIKTEEH